MIGDLTNRSQPVVKYHPSSIAPGVVHPEIILREFARGQRSLPRSLRFDILCIGVKQSSVFPRKVMIRVRWIIVYLSRHISVHFALVFFKKTIVVILRMTLKKYEPKSVRAGGEMDTGIVAFN